MNHSAINRSALIAVACVLVVSACASAPKAKSNDYGVLVMAHGGPKDWDEAVLAAAKPLKSRYPTEVAFGMADPLTLQASVNRLQVQGVQHIGVVRLFVSGESFQERTAQILGLEPGAPPPPAHQHEHGKGGHNMDLWRITSSASFTMADEGLLDAPEMGEVLAKRAVHLSKHPEQEDVLVIAHGPADEDENTRWLAKLEARAEPIRRAAPFRRVQVATLREDWPEKRADAEQRVRDFVAQARANGGTAIVIPFRVQGFGPYAEVLKSLDYASDGVGLLPDDQVTHWIERQADSLRAR